MEVSRIRVICWVVWLNSANSTIAALYQLLRKYRDTPMSSADAGVVRMAEIHDNHSVLTLDSDFTLYRKHSRTPINPTYPAATPD